MIQMIRDGNEELIRSATAYVEGLGVSRKDIHSLTVGGRVGGPMTITLEIYVDPARVQQPATDEALPITIERGLTGKEPGS